ncbi:MAG TPA: DUF523 domain-containing protein [Clostridiales bacterium]|jgi:uncharacterized protein YbbK (DUF523 family)|nr:DUF523 domain-containing protein [Clostridiales bacterium]
MNKKENLLISACLLGLYCRYDGKELHLDKLQDLMEKYHLIPICPEIMGGMGTPRNPIERKGDKAVDSSGKDITEHLEKGAKEALKLAKLFDCKYALLKERSPSCGFGRIYDGTFSGTLINGNGVAADLLDENGIKVFGESKIRKLLDNSDLSTTI